MQNPLEKSYQFKSFRSVPQVFIDNCLHKIRRTSATESFYGHQNVLKMSVLGFAKKAKLVVRVLIWIFNCSYSMSYHNLV
jgi:hypothetical protein